jgi:hypothetical protein
LPSGDALDYELLLRDDASRPSSIVAYWRLNDNDATTVVEDSSGNGNTGTLVGGSNTEDISITGYDDLAFNINGIDDYIDTGDPFQTTLRSSFSVGFLAKPIDGRPAVNEHFLGEVDTTGADSSITLRYGNTGQLTFDYKSEGNAGNLARTANAVFADGPATDWTFIAIVADAAVSGIGGKKIYVNAVEQSLEVGNDGSTAGVTFADFTSIRNLYLGARNNAGFVANHYEGGIDDVRLYTKALSADEVAALYASYSDFASDGRGVFTPTATIMSDMPLNAVDVTVDLADVEGLTSVVVDTYAIIDDEILKVLSVDAVNDQVQLARGCLDTVPEAHGGIDSHGAGSRVWFIESAGYFCGREFTATDQPAVKILPRTPLGQLSDDTPYTADAFNSRAVRPYPPGDFKVNGSSYPASFSGQPTISWAHRDRTQQITSITEHSDPSIGPETSVTYTLTIHDDTDVQCRQETGLTGTSYTYSEADEMSDCGIPSGGPLNTKLRFKLKAVRGSYDSWQEYDIWVNRV